MYTNGIVGTLVCTTRPQTLDKTTGSRGNDKNNDQIDTMNQAEVSHFTLEKDDSENYMSAMGVGN